jgi:hypothetical protein
MASLNVSHKQHFFYFQVIQERKFQREFSERSVNEEMGTGKFILVSSAFKDAISAICEPTV